MADWPSWMPDYFGPLNIVIQLAVFYLIIFPIGSLVWSFIRQNKETDDLFLEMPFKLATGFLVATLVFFFVGIFSTTLSLAVLLASGIWYVYTRRHLIVRPFHLGLHRLPPTGSVVLVMVFWMFLCSQIAWIEKWPPAGDPVIHGLYISLANFQGKTPLSLFPLPVVGHAQIIDYPLGFHMLGATLDNLMGLPPGQMMLLVAVGAMALLPVVTFALTYTFTHSNLASIISTLVFLLPPVRSGQFLEMFPLGYLYDGVYPVIVGTLLLLLVFSWFASNLHSSSRKHVVVFSTLAVIGLLITYPPFAIFPLGLAVVFGLSKKVTRASFAVFGGFALASIAAASLFRPILAWTGFGTQTNLSAYEVSLPFLVANPVFIVVLSTSFVYCAFKAVRKPSFLHVSFVGIAIIIVATLDYLTYSEFLWFVLPSRLYFLFSILGFVLFGIMIDKALFRKARSWTSHRVRALIGFAVPIALAALILVSVSGQISLATQSSWLPYNNDDWNAVQWIIRNVPTNDLLLNDRSYAGVFITSFQFRQVVNNLRNDNPYLDANQMLDRPWDQNLQSSIFDRYPIRYVYVSTDSTYWDNASKSYKTGLPRPELNEILSLSDNLVPVYRSGLASIYEVVQNRTQTGTPLKIPFNSIISTYSAATNSSSSWKRDGPFLNISISTGWTILAGQLAETVIPSPTMSLVFVANATKNADIGVWLGNNSSLSSVALEYPGQTSLIVKTITLSPELRGIAITDFGLEVGSVDGYPASVNWLLVGLYDPD